MKGLFPSIVVMMLTACASTPNSSTQENSAKAPASSSQASTSSTHARPATLPPYLDAHNLLSQKRSVYFDLDEYSIKQEFRPTVEAHAKYLSEHRNQTIKIEGNADERGSREYNLALGQKRAEAVKKQMVTIGAGENQIQTTSLGKEKPKALGHDEAAWTENRRGDIKYAEDK